MSHYDCPECPPLHDGVARLRAEVEILESRLAEMDETWGPIEADLEWRGQSYGKIIERLEQAESERDEAQEHERVLVQDLQTQTTLTQETLAQVAVALMSGVEWTLKRLTKPEEWPMSWEAKFPGLKVQAILDLAPAIPAEARALLDRLQRAEAVVEAAKRVTQGHRETCFESSDPVGALAKALAAWEEGKA